jgi:hypothetical protein
LLINVNSASAGLEYIYADVGGIVQISNGTYLEILPNSLNDDTWIFARMWYWPRLDIMFFWFIPSGTVFSVPARLHIPLTLFSGDLDEFGNEYGESVVTYIEGNELIVEIPNFSYYYYPRR